MGESTESKEPPELTRKQSLERRDSTSSTSSIASRMLVPQIKGDVGRNTSRDFFANMSTELNGLATQTTSMFSDFFGGELLNPSVRLMVDGVKHALNLKVVVALWMST